MVSCWTYVTAIVYCRDTIEPECGTVLHKSLIAFFEPLNGGWPWVSIHATIDFDVVAFVEIPFGRLQAYHRTVQHIQFQLRFANLKTKTKSKLDMITTLRRHPKINSDHFLEIKIRTNFSQQDIFLESNWTWGGKNNVYVHLMNNSPMYFNVF